MLVNSTYNTKPKSLFLTYSSMFIFILIVVINLLLELAQALYGFSLQSRIILSNIQIISLLIISYKYLIKGFITTILLSVINGTILYHLYQQTYDDLFMQIATFRFFTLFLSGIICILAYKQKRMNKQFEATPYIDHLTDAFNHVYFQERLDTEIKGTNRLDNSLGLIMLDIDNFRKFNETFGHREGDFLLKQISKIIRETISDKDIMCRFGGDVFTVLIPNLKQDEISLKAQSIKDSVESYFYTQDYKRKINISLSLGYSIYPSIASTRDELISQAEEALYHAKQTGKNNIRVYQDIFNDIRDYISVTENQMLISLKLLLGTVSAKDRYTLGHSERVMEYSIKIGKSLGLTDDQIRILKIAALLHDIGKVEIPQNILNKKGPLTNEEFGQIKMHPIYSADIVEPLASFGNIRDVIRQHHEKFDGTGYPDGLSKINISLEARILAVADAYDAMLSERPYRKPLSKEQAKAELRKWSGKQFDPQIVNAFIQVLQDDIIIN